RCPERARGLRPERGADPEGGPRFHRAIPDRPRRAGRRRRPRADARRRPCHLARGHPALRNGALMAVAPAAGDRLPIGVALGPVGGTAEWWLESARRLEDAGYRAGWSWDHFPALGGRPVP